MCNVLELSRSTYYYHANLCEKEAHKTEDRELSEAIESIFKASRNNYGIRKIKVDQKYMPYDTSTI